MPEVGGGAREASEQPLFKTGFHASVIRGATARPFPALKQNRLLLIRGLHRVISKESLRGSLGLEIFSKDRAVEMKVSAQDVLVRC